MFGCQNLLHCVDFDEKINNFWVVKLHRQTILGFCHVGKEKSFSSKILILFSGGGDPLPLKGKQWKFWKR